MSTMRGITHTYAACHNRARLAKAAVQAAGQGFCLNCAVVVHSEQLPEHVHIYGLWWWWVGVWGAD